VLSVVCTPFLVVAYDDVVVYVKWFVVYSPNLWMDLY
jgi:hypothetical protein